MFLGLDLGTSKVKAVLAEPTGRIVARGSAPVKMFPVGDDGVEQDIEDIWAATQSAIGQVAELGDLSSVQAIGVSSQGGALVICDGAGQPIGRVVSWLDGRGRAYDDEITRELGSKWFARHTGHGRSRGSVGQLLRLRRESPELLCRTNHIGFVGDVIVFRLSGRFAHDATSLSIATLFNPSLRAADPEVLEKLRISEDQLPELLSPWKCAGTLREEVAESMSLPTGIPVSPAVHDQYASAVGVGAIHQGDVMFGAGTAWVLLAAVEPTSSRIEPVMPEAIVSTHLVEGLYGQMLSLVNGGSALTWAMDLLRLDLRTPDEIDTMLEAVPAGSDGLRFWPFLVPKGGAGLLPGTPGALRGLRLSHGAAHIIRAVVEGLALELARYLRFLTDGGIAVQRLVMCGGAAASRVTPQIMADATGLSIECAAESDTSALGAAIIACALTEPSADLVSLSEAMRPPVRLFRPGGDAALYRQLFNEYIASLPMTCSQKSEP